MNGPTTSADPRTPAQEAREHKAGADGIHAAVKRAARSPKKGRVRDADTGAHRPGHHDTAPPHDAPTIVEGHKRGDHAADDAEQEWGQRVHAHRRRQASVSAILDQTFGRFAASDPALWDRRTYLMLVGIVYERLATNETEIPTEELIALAKLLAESRRADNQSRARDASDSDASPESTAPLNGRLPDAFGDVVRQIYGTSVESPARDRDEGIQSSAPAG